MSLTRTTFLSQDREIPLDLALPSSQPSAAILLLHGAGGNIGYWVEHFAGPVAEAGVALFAPHYFAATGTTLASPDILYDGVSVPRWLSAADDCLRFAAAHPAVDPSRIALVGMSLGGFLALSLAAQLSSSADSAERHRIRCVLELSGGLVPPYAALATEDFPPTLALHGADDDTVSAQHARDLDALLTTLNIEHDVQILPNEGHWFSRDIAPQLFLKASSFLGKHLT